MDIDKLVSVRPNFGYSTDEPSLRELVHKYYLAHFPMAEAEKYTEQYFAQLEQMAQVK